MHAVHGCTLLIFKTTEPKPVRRSAMRDRPLRIQVRVFSSIHETMLWNQGHSSRAIKGAAIEHEKQKILGSLPPAWAIFEKTCLGHSYRIQIKL